MGPEAPPCRSWREEGQLAQVSKQRSWLLRPLAPVTHSCVPPSSEGGETAAGKLHMETMGSVFFHLCCQTCSGWGLWATRMWPVMRFLEEG